MKRPLVVNIAPIRSSLGARLDLDRIAHLDELRTSGASVDADADVSFEGFLEAVDGGIVAEGVVRAPWTGECRRCLGPATNSVEARVRELFEHRATEGETYPLNGDLADLEPLVREAVMLDLPVAPLCREDCKGLCPNCGTNWNEGSCECSDDQRDPRWSALDALRIDDASA